MRDNFLALFCILAPIVVVSIVLGKNIVERHADARVKYYKRQNLIRRRK